MRVKDAIKHKVVIFVKDGELRIMHSRKVRINLPGKRMYYCHHSSHKITEVPTFETLDEYIRHLMKDHGDDEAQMIASSISTQPS